MSLKGYEDIERKLAAYEAEQTLEELGVPLEEEPSEVELAAAESRDWLRYNVAMTGFVPLMDEERNKD
jgi:hypothetical protein